MKYRRQRDPNSPALEPHRRRKRGLGVVPTLFTLGNAVCGFASLHYASRGGGPADGISNYAIACYLVFLAMLFDMFDGFVARLTKSTSDFGAELDSLADMLSFGVAPAFIALKLTGTLIAQEPGTQPAAYRALEFLGPNADNDLGKLFWIIGALYVCCTAMRLARFNVINKHDVDSHMNFRGLPSPGAAGVVVSTILFYEGLHGTRHMIPFRVPAQLSELFMTVFPYLIPLVLLIAALLMVSRFAYAHLINRFLRGRRRFNYVVRLVIVVLLVFWQPQIMALLAIYIYAISAPAVWAWRLVFGRRLPAQRAPVTGELTPPAPTNPPVN